MLTPDSKQLRLTSARFGVSDISLYKDLLVFSDYTLTGDKVATFPVNTETAIETRKVAAELAFSGSLNSETIKSFNTVDQGEFNYSTRPYRKWKHLFNIHSWMPFYADVNNISFDNIEVSPGFTLMSQNHLSTLTTSLGYEYTDANHYLRSSLSWKGWYPGIDLDISYGGEPLIYQDDDELFYPETVYPGLRLRSVIYLPLRFRSGVFSQTFWPSLSLSYRNNYVFEEDGNQFDYGQFISTGRLYFSNLHRMSKRDIWPEWGQVVDAFHTFSPGDNEIYGPISTFRSTLYFPGIGKNHGIRIKAQFEKQQFEKLVQRNRINFPRGYRNIISSQLSSYSADYSLPLLYPDFNLGSLLYMNRIRSVIFYDRSKGKDNYHVLDRNMVHDTEIFSSYGIELLADFYLLRIPFRFSGGGQFAWLHEQEKPYFNFLMSIDVFGFVIDSY